MLSPIALDRVQTSSSSAILGQHHESTFGGNQFDQLIDDAEAAAAAAAVAAATSKRNDANGPTPTSDIDTPLHVASRPANVESPQRAPLTAERATSEKQAGTMRLVGDASDDESVQQRLATFKIGVASPVRDFPTGNDAAAQHDGVDRMSTPSSASSSSSSSSSDPVEQAATRSVTTQPNQQAPPVQDSVIKRLHDLTKSMFAPFETIISDKPATNSNHKPMIEPKQQHNATDANREVNVCTVDTTNDQMPVAPRGSASKECANTAIQMLPQNDEIEITNHNHAFDIMDDNTATSNKPAATEAAVSSAVINTSDSSGISSAADLDDDEHRVKLIEQNYGGNSDRIHTAAVIIQRAFRKYEICKRFRTITEQLRHHQSTTTATPTVTRQSGAGSCSSSGASLSTTVAGSSDKSRDNIITASSANDYDAPGDEFTKRNGSETQQSRHYIAASGATRAAAWESLSYAASCLAAATLSAEQTRQQAKSNNQKRREADEADEAAAAKQQLLNDKSSQTQTEMVVNETINCARNIASPLIIKQQESVYAAALNFQQLEAMRKRQYRVGLYIFNKDPEKGLSFLIAHSFIDSISPFAKTTSGYYHSNQVQFFENKQHLTSRQSFKSDHGLTEQQAQCQLCIDAENLKRNVAHFLLHRKGLAKEKIGQYLGNLQSKFNQDVLVYYLQELDFYGLQIDLALRKFLATFRLPGEAQKIERIVDCFATRYVQCQQQQNHQMPLNVSSLNIAGMSSANSNQTSIASTTSLIGASTITPQQTCYRNNLMLLSKDEIFILTFAIIMLNTDLHAPSLKPTSRMSPIQFVNNLRGIFKSQTINKSDLIEIYERVKANQISTTPDHVMHVMKVQQSLTNLQKMELPVSRRRFCMFRAKSSSFQANRNLILLVYAEPLRAL